MSTPNKRQGDSTLGTMKELQLDRRNLFAQLLALVEGLALGDYETGSRLPYLQNGDDPLTESQDKLNGSADNVILETRWV